MTLTPSPIRPLVMGIVNVTPDSFSDGGRYLDSHAGIAHGLKLASEGADVLDIGGESTRPGAEPVSLQQEMDRVLPVIEGLKARIQTRLSVDTMKPELARAAMVAGATLWNDVNGLRAPGALETAAQLGCDVIVMHMAGTPQTMQSAPSYDDVVAEVVGFLKARILACQAAGISVSRVAVDPGIGFGKTLAHNLALVAATGRICAEIGRPLVFGASRKRFIGAICHEMPQVGVSTPPSAPSAPDERLGGSLAAALFAARLGAHMIRVHDVRETVQALKVQAALLNAASPTAGTGESRA